MSTRGGGTRGNLMASHALIYLCAFALPGFIGFFSFSIYTRILPPSEYAVYTVGASLSFFIGSVAYGWIRFALGRYQAEAPELNFLPFVLSCFAIVTIALTPLAIGISFALPNVPLFAMAAILSLTVAQALFDITQEIRRARHQSASFARASVVRSMLSFSCAVGGAFYFDSGAGLVLGISVGFFMLSLRFLVTNWVAIGEGGVSLAVADRFIRYGMPLALSGLVISGNSTIARLLVGAMLGADDAGRFGAALDVTSQIAGILAASISSILGPTAIRANKQDGTMAAHAKLTDGAELFLATMIPATVGLILIAHPFGAVVAGPSFEAAVQSMLPLLAVSRGLNAFAQFYLHLGFQIVERPLRQVACGATTLAVNVIASTVLLWAYGVEGAVWGLLLGDVVGVAVSFLLLRPIFAMPLPMAGLFKVAIATAAMVAVCAPIASMLVDRPIAALLVTPVTGAVVYAIAAYGLDIARLRSELADAGVRRVKRWLKK